MDLPDWYGVLEEARKLSPRKGYTFTAPVLAEALRVQGPEGVKFASKWIHKFKTWGYLEVTGTEPSSGNRPLNVCQLTDKGRKCQRRPGRAAQLDQLLAAIAAFRKARGKPAEAQAVKALFETADSIEE